MGRCTVVERKGEGLYQIQIVYDNARVDARIEELKTLIFFTEREKPDLLDKLNEARVVFRQEFNTLFGVSQRGLTLVEELQLREANLKALLKLESVTIQWRELLARIEALKLERERLQEDTAEPEPIDAWCIDYTTALPAGAEYGAIEINGELHNGIPVLIQAGYAGNALPVDARDGKTQPVANQSPWGFGVNFALKPGWQKWRPTYRLAIITRLDVENNLCDISLEPAKSTEQDIDINAQTEYVDVPVNYMNCHARAFVDAEREGHKVVVGFINQDFEKPQVIGFQDNPVPCFPDFLVLPVNDANVDGYGTYEPQLFSLSPEGLDWLAGLQGVWSTDLTPQALTPTQTPDPDDAEIPSLGAIAFANTDWRGANGVTLRWWSTSTRHWVGAHVQTTHVFRPLNSFGTRPPTIEYPGHVWGFYQNLLVVIPDTLQRQSIYQQQDIYRDGRVFTTAPKPVFGAAITEDPDGVPWIIAACGELLNADDNIPNWSVINDITDVPGKLFTAYARDTFTYVARTVIYAAPEAEPNQWIEIGELPYTGDGNARLALAQFRSDIASNREGWFFSESGTKAVSIKSLDPTDDKQRIEMAIIWQTEDDEGNIFPEPLPTVEFAASGSINISSTADSLKTVSLSNGLTNTPPFVGGRWANTINNVSYTSASTTLTGESTTTENILAYDYRGEELYELFYKHSRSASGTGSSGLINMVNQSTEPGETFWQAEGRSASLQYSALATQRLGIRPQGGGTEQLLVDDTEETTIAYSLFAPKSLLFDDNQEPGTASGSVTVRRFQSFPEIAFLDLREGVALFKVHAFTDTIRTKDTSTEYAFLWRDNQSVESWDLRNPANETPPEALPVIGAINGDFGDVLDAETWSHVSPDYINATGYIQPFTGGGAITSFRNVNSPTGLRTNGLENLQQTSITINQPGSTTTRPVKTNINVLGGNELVAVLALDGGLLASARLSADPLQFAQSIFGPDPNNPPIESEANYIDTEKNPIDAIELLAPAESDVEGEDAPTAAELRTFLTMIQTG